MLIITFSDHFFRLVWQPRLKRRNARNPGWNEKGDRPASAAQDFALCAHLVWVSTVDCNHPKSQQVAGLPCKKLSILLVGTKEGHKGQSMKCPCTIGTTRYHQLSPTDLLAAPICGNVVQCGSLSRIRPTLKYGQQDGVATKIYIK